MPPAQEQRRIVAKVDSLFAKTNRAREELAHIPRLIEGYKQAILAAVFRGELTNNGEQQSSFEMPLGRVTLSSLYGPRFSKKLYVADGIPTLRTTDFTEWGDIVLRSPPTINVSAENFARWKLEDGDLLVTRTGSIGKCAVYSSDLGPALPSAYLIRLRLDQDRIRPRYAFRFLQSPSGQNQLGLGVTAVTQPNINAHVLSALKLPVPPLQQQDAILAAIETAFAWVDTIAKEHDGASRLISRLDQAILAKAFKGELVPQDPNDEPANALLERIRAERADLPQRQGRRGRRARTAEAHNA